MIPKVEPAAVISALAQFDNELRESADWQDWEKNRNHRYAIERNGRLYPVKQIIHMATGTSKREFNGGPEANGYITDLGFTIVQIQSADRPSVQFHLEEILKSYPQHAAGPFGRIPELQAHFDEIRRALLGTRIFQTRPTLEVSYSMGRGNWARVPWIAIMDGRETKTTQEGVYCVLLFRSDMSGVYITFNQGVTDPKKRLGAAGGLALLRGKARELAPLAANLVEHGFRLDDAIDLRVEAGLGREYESSTIAHKLYERGAVPDDEDILDDVDAVVQTYDSYLSRKASGGVNVAGPQTTRQTAYVPPSFEDIRQHVLVTEGLRLDERILRQYHIALETRGFVILSGISGSGKTWLTEAYANAIGAAHLLVPVAPNWTTNEDLLGFFNPLDGTYHDTSFSRFLRAAAVAHEDAREAGLAARPYHLILDEMNLARVEYYFAKFLSAMELRSRRGVAPIELGPNESVLLAPNLKFVGTVNIDETTHGFADKVYDRAQLIELSSPRELLVAHVANAPFGEIVMDVWACVHEVAPFGFRVLDDMRTYVARSQEMGIDWQEAFDEQVLQKILPKVKGADPRVGDALQRLIELATGRLPLTLGKAIAMHERYRQHGFTSYF